MALAVCTMLLAGIAGAQECQSDAVDIRDADTAVRFQVEVMDTPESRAQGLMHRENLDRFSGMLFIYETPQPVAFWMHNTLIPLDMLFFDSSGTLRKIHENARPLDRTPIPGGDDIQYVLEINGGAAGRLGIEVGAEIRHPGLNQEVVAWGC